MRSLVTGIGGFAGSHLADLLIQRGDETAGMLGPMDTLERIEHLAEKLSLYHGDITRREGLDEAFKDFRPQRVFHLAGAAHVGGSWAQKESTLTVNIMGAFNVLEAASGCASSVLLVGSGEQYGLVPQAGQPIKEDRPLAPTSPYGASKAAQEMLGLQYFLGEGRPVFLARAFNHCGARQDPLFVVSDFARQVAEIEAKRRPPEIRVGNLEARRDFTDVRDMMKGYLDLVEKGDPGVPYNLCSGRAVPVSAILDKLIEQAQTSIEVAVDEERYRPSDNPLLVGDPGLALKAFGWSAKTPLEETLSWTLEYWREQVSRT